MEGAFGDVDTSWLSNIKDKNTKNEINKKLNLIASIKFIVILLLSIPDLLKSLSKYSQNRTLLMIKKQKMMVQEYLY
ncbi:MAG: hypothetical protein LBL16_00725 [Endomicrobium sp.]|jgi:hypothetical protein|nr:hypothetical protein [Endomicrobium sp.]